MFGKKKNKKDTHFPTDDKTNRKSEAAGKPSAGIIILNILGMMAASVALVFLALGGLKLYTRHYNSVEVPSIKGLSQDDARKTLKALHLDMEVVDSVYNEALEPGIILDTTPAEGAIIKDRRTIYVIINNMQIKKATVPDVYEVSRRQAEALVRRAGFSDLNVAFVPGEYNNLALRLKNRLGQILVPGDELPFNEPITLEVSSKELLTDSLKMQNDSLIHLQNLPTTPINTIPQGTPSKTTTSDDDEEGWF